MVVFSAIQFLERIGIFKIHVFLLSYIYNLRYIMATRAAGKSLL